MRRRRFLACGTALLSVPLAGCGHPPVVLDMDETSAADIADEVAMTPNPGTEEYSVVETARENGSATRHGRYELFDRTDTVRVGDSFYEISETPVGSEEVTVYTVLVDIGPDSTTAERGEIAYEELPEVDRQRLEPVATEESPSNQDGYDFGVDYGTTEEVGNESVFVPDQEYDVLVHDGNRSRITVESRTATQTEYRYEVTEVAASTDAFADGIRTEYLFTLSGLSDAEREVVEQAIEGGYFEDDEAFQSVVDRIREHDAISVDDFYGTWLLEYENVEYLTYAEW